MTKGSLSTTSAADLLMMSGVVRECPDCVADQIFVPVDDGTDVPHELSVGAYCCTSCGAAILVGCPEFDGSLESAVAGVRGVA